MKSLNALQPLALLTAPSGLWHHFHVAWLSDAGALGRVERRLFSRSMVCLGISFTFRGCIELFGGGLLLLGLFTRGAALFLAIEMVLLMWKVHYAA